MDGRTDSEETRERHLPKYLLCQASALYPLMSAGKAGLISSVCRQGNQGLEGLDLLGITRLANEESEQNASQHPLWPWRDPPEGTSFSSWGGISKSGADTCASERELIGRVRWCAGSGAHSVFGILPVTRDL